MGKFQNCTPPTVILFQSSFCECSLRQSSKVTNWDFAISKKIEIFLLIMLMGVKFQNATPTVMILFESNVFFLYFPMTVLYRGACVRDKI